ncbi:hypothetical protein Pst134EA_030450 [Puccinia striiformis f. sp. tritici]|uniref:hypothetical protein n=1 Tax=Puccinia striiformis f. sp. tritici TaxID=168172 RepID=UPI002007AE3B|nr:hypothetical protein Pst134EA_030450 [Puccinia striiformis f. sp. tritici]KAH9446538.1 hypothetical protein Pst134EA_030450 [Puccinia striiformis f. sp. tritici]
MSSPPRTKPAYHRHHQISINSSSSSSAAPSISIPYSDHTPPPTATSQNQVDQDVQAALHFSRARAGTLSQATPKPSHEQQLWSNQDLLDSQQPEGQQHTHRDSHEDDAFIDHRYNPSNFHHHLHHHHHSQEESSISQAEEDVCFPLRPSLDQRLSSTGYVGGGNEVPLVPIPTDNPTTIISAGMLPHFPFPFNFNALEEFAQIERDNLETLKNRSILINHTHSNHAPKPPSGSTSFFPGLRKTIPNDDCIVDDDNREEETMVRRRRINFIEGGGGTRNSSGIEGDIDHQQQQRRLSENNVVRPISSTKRKLALFEGATTSIGAGNLFNFNSQTDGSAISGGVKQPSTSEGGGKIPFLNASSSKRFPFHSNPSQDGHRSQVRWNNTHHNHNSNERPYRFSFYSNALPSTIHARSLAEIPGEGQSFESLFVGRSRPKNTDGQGEGIEIPMKRKPSIDQDSISKTISSSLPGPTHPNELLTDAQIASATGGPFLHPPIDTKTSSKPRSDVLIRTDQDAEASTWWLDVLCPTDQEMKLLSKVFGIHPLTTEDIQMEETREKIELFRNYYLVCFRSFDQDPYSPTYLEPLNIYIIVFREGTLSFHFRATPHPQNVRRRIKQLKDYINVTSDWISYALIDDITDAFGPLIQSIEYEVDSIDELVLILKDVEQSDMLRRIGTCRKKVMGLLRLMGNKADVVKGLAKRCNENWSVAPKSDIGLYLSDIQDHLVTMTQNLNHYEKILSRSHSNYLAQISIEMTDANNQINDVLSKLTALGSILVPMNLVTGLWGMNVHVPGQDITEGYAWFIAIVCGLVSFGVVGAWLTLRYFKFSNH